MHGRGSRCAAPAFDTVWRGDVQGTPLTARRCRFGPRLPRGFFFFHRLAPTRLRLGSIRADSGRIGRNRRNGRFKPKRSIQAEIQTLSLSLHYSSPLLCALCGVRVLDFTESLSTSLSLLFDSASPQQHNTNATLLARDKELQYKKTLITPKCPLLCILLDP